MNTEKRLTLWLVWNYEREQQRLDKRSEQGLHLVKPGLFWSLYERDPSARYVYRLDYQPDVRNKDSINEYLTLYQDAGWTYLGECMGWHYFRQPWVPDKTLEIYTDRESLKQHYRRIQRVIGLLLFVELLLFILNIKNFVILPIGHHLWPAYVPLFVLLAAVVILLGYGVFALQRKVKALDNQD